MATVINNPPSQGETSKDSGGTGMSVILGILLAVIVVILLLVFGWPALKQSGSSTPDSGTTGGGGNSTGGPTYNVPDKTDIKVPSKGY